MILVAGGTGRLGSLVANRLCDAGESVRVLSRGLKPDAGQVRAGVEGIRADVRDPSTLETAMRDVDVVVSAVQGFLGPDHVTPESVDKQGNGNLVTAAERAGADVVMLSVVGASADNPMELFRMKYHAEQRLRKSTCRWTVVRAEAYAETWVGILQETGGRSGRPLVFGRGDNPISWVSVDDVAALVVRAVTDPSMRGRVLDICGPEPMTLAELATKVMAQEGVPGKPRRIPRAMLHVMANTVGRVRPPLGRQARTSLAMDDMPTSRDAETRTEFPDLPCTPVSTVVATVSARTSRAP